MSVKQRLIEFAKSQEKFVKTFETKCGLTIGYVNAIRVSIHPDKILKIISQYPNLNTEWLLTGEGERLKKQPLQYATFIFDSTGRDFNNTNENSSVNIETLKKELQICEENLFRLKDIIIGIDKKLVELNKKQPPANS